MMPLDRPHRRNMLGSRTVDSPSLRYALDIENRTQVMCSATGELGASFAWGPL